MRWLPAGQRLWHTRSKVKTVGQGQRRHWPLPSGYSNDQSGESFDIGILLHKKERKNQKKKIIQENTRKYKKSVGGKKRRRMEGRERNDIHIQLHFQTE